MHLRPDKSSLDLWITVLSAAVHLEFGRISVARNNVLDRSCSSAGEESSQRLISASVKVISNDVPCKSTSKHLRSSHL